MASPSRTTAKGKALVTGAAKRGGRAEKVHGDAIYCPILSVHC